VRLSETGWGDTAVLLPDGSWTNRIGGGRFSGRVLAAELFADLPVALLERTDD
jgi:(1->4)-alpha-D-glucan 1-alpha-D-glucosylmutase